MLKFRFRFSLRVETFPFYRFALAAFLSPRTGAPRSKQSLPACVGRGREWLALWLLLPFAWNTFPCCAFLDITILLSDCLPACLPAPHPHPSGAYPEARQRWGASLISTKRRPKTTSFPTAFSPAKQKKTRPAKGAAAPAAAALVPRLLEGSNARNNQGKNFARL